MKRAECRLRADAVVRLALASALGIAAGACSKAPQTASVPTVAVARAERTHLASAMTLQGEFYPHQDILVFAKVSGYVRAIPVDIGDRVKAGDLIATLEVPELADQLAAAAVALARAETSKYRTLMDYTRITAPFAGVVTKRFADLGSLIQAGTSAGTNPTVELAEDDLLRLRFPVPEAETPLVHPGTLVQCTVDAVHRTFSGRIVRDEWAIERSTRTMIAEVDVPNPGGDLKAGMYATIVLPLRTVSSVIAVPLQALSGGEQPTVMVLGSDDILSERRVAVGLRTATSAEIGSGLAEGDLVVVGDRSGLHSGDGATSRVVEE